MRTRARPPALGGDRGHGARALAGSLSLATIIVLAFLLVLPGCKQAANEVVIKDLRFNPKVLTVNTGTTVTWVNKDQTAHTITSDSNDTTSAPTAAKFKSKILNPGDSFAHTFETAGSYKYHCDIHPYLKGEVIVH